jgi:hypothetical protein
MRDIIAALGLKNASPHDLRRTGATNMVCERLGSRRSSSARC